MPHQVHELLQQVQELLHQMQEILHQVQLEQKADLTLNVKVKRADCLMARKGHGKSDPYCKLAVVGAEQEQLPLHDLTDWREKGTLGELLICQTDVQHYTLEPEWNQDFSIQLKDSGSNVLAVEIWDSEDKIGLRQVNGTGGWKNYLKDLRGGNNFLGKTYINLQNLPVNGVEEWYQLKSHQGQPRGQVQLKLHIEIKGVSHKEALELYERLYETLCAYKSLSTPDSVSVDTQWDKGNPDWSGTMSSSVKMQLSLFSSLFNITRLEVSIVHLGRMLQCHRRRRVDLSAFQSTYTVILSLQDELVLDGAAQNGAPAQDNASQNWLAQKLCACTKSLSNEIHDVIKKHFAEKDSMEVDRFRQQIGLLKVLYQVKVFQAVLPPEETNLAEVITMEIKDSCAHWYHSLEKKALEESPDKLPGYVELVKCVVGFLKNSRDCLQNIFNEVDVNYLEIVYVAVEGPLARGLSEALSENLPQTFCTANSLYHRLKEFKAFSSFVSETKHEQLKLTNYHTHFHGMVNNWITLAIQPLNEGVVDATQRAVEEETVTKEAKFSATARAVIGLVVRVCTDWKDLGWPVATESFEYLTTVVRSVCSSMEMYSKESCNRLKVNGFFSPTPDTFKATKKLYIALNDIEHVRQGVQELPKFTNWSHFQEVLAEEESREKAAEADKVLKDTLSATDQAIQQVLTSLTENIAEKMRPDIKRGLRNVMVATTPDAIEEVVSPLMTYLQGNIHELGTNLFKSVFLQLLTHIWLILMGEMQTYTDSTRKETVSFCLHSLLNKLFGFFHAEGDGLAKEVLETEQYTLLHEKLSLREMTTEKVIQRYCETLADFQATAPTTKVTLTVMVGYMKEKQAVELKLIRATNLPSVTVANSCVAYLKMSLLSPDNHFSTAERQKSKVDKPSLNPVFDATFLFPTTRVEHLQVQGAVLCIELYSYNKLRSHTPIGVVVIRCKDIPILAPNTVPEGKKLEVAAPQMKTMTLTIVAPCDSQALTELSERSKDATAVAFARRIKKLKEGHIANLHDGCAVTACTCNHLN